MCKAREAIEEMRRFPFPCQIRFMIEPIFPRVLRGFLHHGPFPWPSEACFSLCFTRVFASWGFQGPSEAYFSLCFTMVFAIGHFLQRSRPRYRRSHQDAPRSHRVAHLRAILTPTWASKSHLGPILGPFGISWAMLLRRSALAKHLHKIKLR